MSIEKPEVLIKETHLSKKPAEGSALVAAASLLVLGGFSLLFWSDTAGCASLLPVNGEAILKDKEYWRLFTSIFVHSDLKHLLSNALGIAFLSYLLFGYFGYKVYPILILIMGAVVTFLSVITYPPQVYLIGASGVVYLMAGFWIMLYICLERRFSLAMRFIRAIGFSLIVLIPTEYNPTTSYRTHFIGLGVGVIVATVYFLANKTRFRELEIVETDWE
jgi:rhomboid protease GluP